MPFIRPIISSGGMPAPEPASDHTWNETSIVGTAPVTGWDDAVGSVNLTRPSSLNDAVALTTQNGLDCLVSENALGNTTLWSVGTAAVTAQTFTCLIVCKYNDAGSDQQFMMDKYIGSSGDHDRLLLYRTSATARYFKQNGSSGGVTITDDTNWHVFVYSKSGTVATVYEDDVDLGTQTDTAGMAMLTMFSDNQQNRDADGTIAEVRVWDGTALTPTEVATWTAYMNTKWGL